MFISKISFIISWLCQRLCKPSRIQNKFTYFYCRGVAYLRFLSKERNFHLTPSEKSVINASKKKHFFQQNKYFENYFSPIYLSIYLSIYQQYIVIIFFASCFILHINSMKASNCLLVELSWIRKYSFRNGHVLKKYFFHQQ